MNKIETIEISELVYASRTLETIIITNEKKQQKVLYLYNYEGIHFRIFENLIEVSKFLNDKPYALLKEYLIERYVDVFLEKYKFV